MTIKSRIYKHEEEIEINLRIECAVSSSVISTPLTWRERVAERSTYFILFYISLFFDALRDKMSIGLFECLKRLLNYHQNKLAFSRATIEDRKKISMHKLINIQNGLVCARFYFKQFGLFFRSLFIESNVKPMVEPKSAECVEQVEEETKKMHVSV